MSASKRTARAVFWAALLHVGLAGFLFATTLSCTRWEELVRSLHLPDGWNPITCTAPVQFSGPVIQATLVGPSGAPLPPVASRKLLPKLVPPPASRPRVEPEKPKLAPVKTLPPPPEHPADRAREKVVARAADKAAPAEHVQQQEDARRMSELAANQAKLDAIFKQLDQTRSQRKRVEQQASQQEHEASPDAQSRAAQPAATRAPTPQVASGNASDALAAYQAAIQNAVTQAWRRPPTIPDGAICPIHIEQIPGGQVINVQVDPACPFDDAGKRSVKEAVLRAEPLPYRGFEKQFKRNLTLNFKVND